ncbi:MAG: PD40 domain-containing protein [Thermoflexales bacterium]|nr:PD40 domain-containing protein [Thermoflexales bacterium]
MQIDPPASPTSRLPLILIIVALGLIVTGGVALIVWQFGQLNAPPKIAATPTPIDAAAPIAPAPNSSALKRLAVIDGERLYTIDPDGQHQVIIEPRGEVPTAALIWTRDGQRLVYAQTVGPDSQLISVNVQGEDERVLFESDRVKVPFYLNGAPDDEHIVFLSADTTRGLAMQVAALDQADSARVVARGQPNYASWSPDGQSLLLHVGGATRDGYIGTYRLGDEQPTPIETSPAEFQAPVWATADGRIYARRGSVDSSLISQAGNDSKTLAAFSAGITFSGSPDGEYVAYALNSPDSFLFEKLTVIKRDGTQAKVIERGDVLAFFWSPDGRYLAHLTGALVSPGPIGRAGGLAAPRKVAQPRSLQITWHVIDVVTDEHRILTTFEPNESFLYLIQYFDQFAQSIAVWSPDSRSLVYTGTPFGGSEGVYVVDTQAADPQAQFVGRGDFASWSWR